MKFHNKTLMLSIVGIMTVSCSQEFIPEQNNLSQPDRITELIGNFHKKIHNETRSGNNFKITGISTETFFIPDSLKAESRSAETSDYFDIHTVSVDFGESSGYVILSDTPEIDRVFYYTEAGCINDTAEIAPLKDLVKNIPEIASGFLSTGDTLKSQSTRSSAINIEPLVRFAWHQGPPFNNYAAYCTCDKCKTIGNHRPIGCVTIALGQTIATLKKFNGTFYGNRDIDFDSFPNYGYNFTSSQALSVAHFLQEIAITCQIQFKCSGSGTTAVAAARCLIDNGYRCELLDGSVNVSRLISNLTAGRPHLMGGQSNEGGHMWIIDGIKDVDGVYNVHINWGYGQSKSSGWGIIHNYYDNRNNIAYTKRFKNIYIEGIGSK